NPGPGKLEREERFALSKEALKMKGIFRAADISLRSPARSMTRPSLSMTHGPAIKKNGRSVPTSKDATFMRSGAAHAAGRLMRRTAHAVARPGCSDARYLRAARTKPVNS